MAPKKKDEYLDEGFPLIDDEGAGSLTPKQPKDEALGTPPLEQAASPAQSQGVHMSGVHMTSPTWTPSYEKERSATLSKLQSRAPFSYDPEKDPTYQQYKAQYERGAQKAMQDTMGQVMTRTGGLASSFAQTAGQQSYNATMAQLADKIPELRQLAYQMYMDEENRLRSDLQMYDSLDSSDASRWQATVLSPFQSDRSYALDVDNTLYNRDQDAWERAFKEDDRDYTREQDALERQRQEKLDQEAKDKALAEILASGGNYSGYEGLYGMTPEDRAALEALWKEGYDYDKKGADLDLLSKQLGIDLTRKQIANYGKDAYRKAKDPQAPPRAEEPKEKMSPSTYSSFKGQITNMLRSGSETTAVSLIRKNAAVLSDEAFDELEKLFKQYGYKLE